MSLPVEISPNPLLTSAVEIRYVSNISREEVLAKVLGSFTRRLPKIKEGPVPYSVRVDQKGLEYAPDFVLFNDDFSMSFSDKMISFENVGEYKFWNRYFGFIVEQLTLFKELAIVKQVSRVGVRYASLFQDEFVKQGLRMPPSYEIEGIGEGELRIHSSRFKKDDLSINLQIRPGVKVEKNSEQLEGLVIDIDVFKNFKDSADLDKDFYNLIDILHTTEKRILFEGVLKPEFIEKLNPKY